MACSDREFIVSGTVESGKSHPMLQRLYQLHCQIPNFISFIARKKKVDMRKSIIDQWEFEVLPYPLHDPRSPCRPYGGYNPSAYIWKNGGVTYILGMQEAQSLLGARFDGGYVCQAEQLTLADWEFLSHRTGRAGNWRDINGDPFGQCWGDANPDVSQHWIPGRIAEGKLTGFNAGFKDNIMFYRNNQWTSHGKNRVKHLEETITGIRFRRLILGEWCNSEGIVFPEFDHAVHVIDELPIGIENWQIYQGIDYGHSAPLVCAWIAHDTSTDQMIVFKEWRYTNTLIEDHIKNIQEHTKGLSIRMRVSDHDSQMNHQLTNAGLETEPASKEKGSILRGLDFIRIRLRNKTLKFYKHMLIEEDPVITERNDPRDGIAEFGLYRHKPIEKHIGDSAKDDIPMPGQSDHFIDCVRYVIDKVDREIPLSLPISSANFNIDNWHR